MIKAIAEYLGERQGTLLQLVLGGTIVLFIAILVGSYVIAKRANPIILDEKGRLIQSETTPHGY